MQDWKLRDYLDQAKRLTSISIMVPVTVLEEAVNREEQLRTALERLTNAMIQWGIQTGDGVPDEYWGDYTKARLLVLPPAAEVLPQVL